MHPFTHETTQPAVKYDVQVSPVREVSVVGVADLGYWTRDLLPAGLYPTNRDGKAQVMISGADARFMGIRFRELSISVFVSPQRNSTGQEGAYLCRAFNSLRFFALVERMMFRTPYYQAHVRLDPELPASMLLSRGKDVLLRLAMNAETSRGARMPISDQMDGWRGPLFLPGAGSGKANGGELFFAKLTGQTQTYSFTPADHLTLQPTHAEPIFQQLVESGFHPQQWIVRQAATHGKSKTVPRAAASEFAGVANT